MARLAGAECQVEVDGCDNKRQSVRMHWSPVFALLVTFVSPQILANPIAVDSTRIPITMINEKVDISVRQGSSEVNGVYVFQQGKSYWPGKETHVIVFVPVLQPLTKHRVSHEAPKVSVGKIQIKEQIRNDLALEDTPRSVAGLPRGWFMRMHEYSIPLRYLKNTFSIQVSYTQPHFPGDISAYVPISPPREENSSITFRAESGCALKPYRKGLFSLFDPAVSSVTAVPENRTLIRVKCVPRDEKGG